MSDNFFSVNSAQDFAVVFPVVLSLSPFWGLVTGCCGGDTPDSSFPGAFHSTGSPAEAGDLWCLKQDVSCLGTGQNCETVPGLE